MGRPARVFWLHCVHFRQIPPSLVPDKFARNHRKIILHHHRTRYRDRPQRARRVRRPGAAVADDRAGRPADGRLGAVEERRRHRAKHHVRRVSGHTEKQRGRVDVFRDNQDIGLRAGDRPTGTGALPTCFDHLEQTRGFVACIAASP